MEETTTELLEKLELEKRVARRSLLNEGLPFGVPKKSILKYLPFGEKNEAGKKIRKFTIHKPYLSTMDRMAEVKLQIKINLTELTGSTNPIRYKNEVVKKNNRLMCKIIAIAFLNSTWKWKWFGGFLTTYFNDRIHVENLDYICNIIEEMEDAGNFINSIVLMAGSDRTTMPKTDKIEQIQNPEEKQ